MRTIVAGFVTLGILHPCLSAFAAEVDFAREVLPVLSNKCFVCHGPDTKKKDLVRLDSEEAAKRDLGGYHAVDEKNPEQSELILRIFDEDEPMPPKKFDKTLTPQEKEILKKWALSGGRYAEHWAFVRPERSNKARGNAVDHFVGEGLRAEGKDFASEAPRENLARRVALTLTGLLPSPIDWMPSFGTRTPTLTSVWWTRLPTRATASTRPGIGWMPSAMEILMGCTWTTRGGSTPTATG